MSSIKKIAFATLSAVGLFASAVSHAAQNDPVGCTVTVNYTLNGVLRESYQNSFVVDTVTPFSDDFSTFTRFKFFDATTTKKQGVSTVKIAYFNDVGVFNSVDFTAQLSLREDRSESTEGDYTFYTSVVNSGTARHNTSYSLTCHRIK